VWLLARLIDMCIQSPSFRRRAKDGTGSPHEIAMRMEQKTTAVYERRIPKFEANGIAHSNLLSDVALLYSRKMKTV